MFQMNEKYQTYLVCLNRVQTTKFPPVVLEEYSYI